MFTEENGSVGFFDKIKSIMQAPSEKIESAGNTLSKTVVGFRETQDALMPEESLTFEEWRKRICMRTVDVSPARPVSRGPKPADLDIHFAENFTAQGGRFIYCPTASDIITTLKLIKQESRWDHIFCWENEIKDLFAEFAFQKGSVGFTIENSDAAISLCDSLVAENGRIVFNPKQASRRRLPCFPKTHIILADVNRLEENLAIALERFQEEHRQDLPSVLDLQITDNRHYFDARKLVLNAGGTMNLWVILTDEEIPPTTRP